MKRFGLNKVNRPFKLRVRCTNTPLFYLFLLLIVAGETCADYFYYGYDMWYVQGGAMLFLVFLSSLFFGCGRSRITKRETQLAQERQAAINESQFVSVTRSNVQQSLKASELTVGDKIMLSPGDKVPCDCVVFFFDNRARFVVDESMIYGDLQPVEKKNLGCFNEIVLSSETMLLADSVVTEGHAQVIAIAVGDFSSAATKV